jgi:hypothetical protein
MKINPKITDAATITPTTTVGRPVLGAGVSDVLAFEFPVLMDSVEVLVTVEGGRGGGGLVTTEAERVVELELELDELDKDVVRVFDGVGVEVGRVEVDLVDDLVSVSVSCGPPKRSERNDANGSIWRGSSSG